MNDICTNENVQMCECLIVGLGFGKVISDRGSVTSYVLLNIFALGLAWMFANAC